MAEIRILELPTVELESGTYVAVDKQSGTGKFDLSDLETQYSLPLMDAEVRGGAKLGDGLAIEDGALGIDPKPQESTGEVRGAISSLTAKGCATQDGTPTPESPVAITVARGRNLYRNGIESTSGTYTSSGITYTIDGSELIADGTASGNSWPYLGGSGAGSRNPVHFKLLQPGTYVASSGANHIQGRRLVDDGATVENIFAKSTPPVTFTLNEETLVAVVPIVNSGETVNNLREWIQVERGTTPTTYVPYGHVAITVTYDGTTTTIPVPLPSKGFAAALPDGTADMLTIDGAGKVEWLSAVDHIESYVGESVGDVYLSTTGELSTGSEVYYPLATPTTEQRGYIDWPEMPDGATVTCPELDDLGVRYLIGDSVARMARQWYERARSEYERKISALEQAVAELATA